MGHLPNISGRSCIGLFWLAVGLVFLAPAPTFAADPWTWVSGANSANGTGAYGTLGVPSSANTPPARSQAAVWRDKDGNLWVFGGMRGTSGGTGAFLNDLWEFNPLNGSWTWVSGSSTVANHLGGYGTKGTPDKANTPGDRQGAASWLDGSGMLWLFGGFGFGKNSSGVLNDLWKFDPATSQWTWVAGSDAADGLGTYGTQGASAPSNVPGGRESPVYWPDAKGRFWIFGGNGCDSTQCGIGGDVNKRVSLNDLWNFNPASGQWTWVSGSSSSANATVGSYGTQGVEAAGNQPPGRRAAATWVDCLGNLWMYGGSDFHASATGTLTGDGTQNDLWEFSPSTRMWTWMGGLQNTTLPMKPVYGTQGVASGANSPGSREYATSWTDAAGYFWLFGGLDLSVSGADGALGDLWRFDPSNRTWTWMDGASMVNAAGVYGMQGVPSVANQAGGRWAASGVTDSYGALWLFGGSQLSASSTLNDLWKVEPAAETPLPSCVRLTGVVSELPIYFKILFGVTNDGSGIGILPGIGIVHVPPRDPEGPILMALRQEIPNLVQQAEAYSQAQTMHSGGAAIARERQAAIRRSLTAVKAMEKSLTTALKAQQQEVVSGSRER